MGVWDYYNVTMGLLNGTRMLNKAGSIACQTNINRYVFLGT